MIAAGYFSLCAFDKKSGRVVGSGVKKAELALLRGWGSSEGGGTHKRTAIHKHRYLTVNESSYKVTHSVFTHSNNLTTHTHTQNHTETCDIHHWLSNTLTLSISHKPGLTQPAVCVALR